MKWFKRKNKVNRKLKRWQEEVKKEKDLEEILRKRISYDIKTFYNPDGTIIPYTEVEEAWRCCIDSIEVEYKGAKGDHKVMKYKLCDRQRSIEQLIRFLYSTQG